MSSILDSFKRPGGNAKPAMGLSGAGRSPASKNDNKSDSKGNISNIDSPAANYARERAAAAKAQMEARKTLEESRKSISDKGDKEKGKITDLNKKTEDI